MFSAFNFQQMISAFIVLFAVIDIIGAIPIIINLKEKGKDVNAMKATLISFALLLGFFYAGDWMLQLFHVDIESFAIAGAVVIFLMALEMILDIEIFKNQGPIKEATLVPLVFPLLAGAGAFTTLLTLRAEYASINIIIALVLNMIWVYFVVSMTGRVERFLGKEASTSSVNSLESFCWPFLSACSRSTLPPSSRLCKSNPYNTFYRFFQKLG